MGKHRLEDRELKESARRVVPTTTRTNTTVYYPKLDASALRTSEMAAPAEEPAPAWMAHERAEADGAAQQRAAFAQSLQSGRRQPVEAPRWPEPATPSRSQLGAPGQHTPVQQAPVQQRQAPSGYQPVQPRSSQPSPRQPQRNARQHTVRSEPVARAAQQGTDRPRQSHTVKPGTGARPVSGKPGAGHAKPVTEKPATKRRSHALPSLRKKKDDLFERSFKLCTRCGEHVYVLASSCKHCDAVA